jgi:para-aminobenzoate synthetase component I
MTPEKPKTRNTEPGNPKPGTRNPEPKTQSVEQFRDQMNHWGREGVPFLFIVDFEMRKPLIMRLDDVNPNDIRFDINGYSNTQKVAGHNSPSIVSKRPVSIENYRKKFDTVFHHLNYGDSYLTNLTTRTEVVIDRNLTDIFDSSSARYKLLFKDEFLVFSPEIFIQIRDGMIFSFPMKGTIDAAIPDAANVILNDTKELAEHVTIVDLIRNDLSEVAQHVRVKRFRYIDEINTNDKRLLQVSSEIIGELDRKAGLGDVLTRLLPAGSVSGAPKEKTVQIIRMAEGEQRGYYTGVFGYFDGKQLDSGVMIRFIENNNGKYYYRSGGGITTQSIAEKEYQELIDKVYVPLD